MKKKAPPTSLVARAGGALEKPMTIFLQQPRVEHKAELGEMPAGLDPIKHRIIRLHFFGMVDATAAPDQREAA